jgi:3-dehydroquinate synthase
MAPAAGLALAAARSKRYEVRLTDGLLGRPGAGLLRGYVADRRVLVCTTPTVDRLYGAGLRRALSALGQRPAWLVLDCPEPAKTMATALRICEAAVEAKLDRKGLLVAFGGGACSDLVTVAASMVRRGVAHLRLPTTLIGQIDAGIGLKGAVNLGTAKNYLGCFHPPTGVLVDPALLRSLPDAAMRQGLAEIVKIACVRDAALLDLLRRDGARLIATRFREPAEVATGVLERAIRGMLEELEQNPYEDRSHARAVDFGHTVSPTLEAATGYRLQHGYAVAVDVAFSCALAARLGMLAEEEAERIVGLLLDLGLPVTDPLLTPELVAKAFESVTLHRGGALNLVVPTRVGAYAFLQRAGVPPAAVVEAIRRVNAAAARAGAAGLAA